MSTSVEIKSLVERLVEQGWRVKMTRSNHYRCVPPDGDKPIVFLPSTPSDSRSIQNNLQQLKRSGYRD